MKNEYVVTKELYKEWGKESASHGVKYRFRIGWIICAVVMLLLTVSSYFVIGVKNFYGVYFFILFLFSAYRGFFRNTVLMNSQYKRNAQIFGGENWIRTVEFTENEIITTDKLDNINLDKMNANGNVSVTNYYNEIVEMRDKGNKIWLDTNKHTVIRLYKNCFTDSDFESFKSFINEKIKDN